MASRQTPHVLDFIYMLPILASRHQAIVPPKRFSLGAAGLSNGRRLPNNGTTAMTGVFVPQPHQPHTTPPQVLPCLSADDGGYKCCTPLTYHIQRGALVCEAVDRCCGLSESHSWSQAVLTKCCFYVLFSVNGIAFFQCCHSSTSSHIAPQLPI